MTPERDSFESWLEGFKKEVDAVVASAGHADTPATEEARRSFDNWWDASQDPIPAAAPEPETDRLDALTRENSELRVLLTDLKASTASDREAVLLQSARLETQVRALHEQVNSLKENRIFLEETARKAESAKAAADEELALARERAQQTAEELLNLKRKTADQEAAVTSLRETLAARDGTLDELRRQAGVYQDRLVSAKELTDADVALLRQELRLFVEEFRIMMNTIKKGV